MSRRPEPFRTYFLGDACRCWSLGDAIDLRTSRRVLAAYRRLRSDRRLAELGVLDLVPSYTELAVHAGPLGDWDSIGQIVEQCLRGSPAGGEKRKGEEQRHVLPVAYRGEDLPRIARHSGLSTAEVIALHAAGEYVVAMIGFRPHFPYLLGMDPRLATPRLDSPRLRVPAGAVAIGGEQTGIYPEPSPGGWNILGLTDPALLAAIRPGDTVVFRSTPP